MRHEALNVELIKAQDTTAIKWDFVDKLRKGVLDLIQVAVKIQMLCVYGRDHGNSWGEHQERAIALVGFGNEIFTTTKLSACAQILQTASNDHRRVQIRSGHNRGN